MGEMDKSTVFAKRRLPEVQRHTVSNTEMQCGFWDGCEHGVVNPIGQQIAAQGHTDIDGLLSLGCNFYRGGITLRARYRGISRRVGDIGKRDGRLSRFQ